MNKDLNYYMSLNYRIEVIEDKEEGGYTLHCPDLPGCITCADTIEQGFNMIADAKKCWITACIEDKRQIPEPKSIDNYSGRLEVKLPKSLHKTLTERSRQEGVSVNQYCLYLLSNGVNAPDNSTKSAMHQ